MDPRLFNLPAAIRNVATECVAGGVAVADVATSAAEGVKLFLADHYTGEQAAALLRLQAGALEAELPRGGATADEQEQADLVRRVHEFINTAQVAGMDETTILSAALLAIVERTSRARGAIGAATWLRSMANVVETNAQALGLTSGQI